MSKVSIQAEADFKTFLSKYSNLKVNELEHFVKELNALITRKKVNSPKHRIKELYKLIDETILDIDTQIIFDVLAEKLQAETMTEDENRVYLKIAQQDANLRNQRIAYMIELSQLRQIPFLQLKEELGLKPLPHA